MKLLEIQAKAYPHASLEVQQLILILEWRTGVILEYIQRTLP